MRCRIVELHPQDAFHKRKWKWLIGQLVDFNPKNDDGTPEGWQSGEARLLEPGKHPDDGEWFYFYGVKIAPEVDHA